MQAALDFSRSTWALNPFCDIALEEALKLRDRRIVDHVTVVSVGDGAAAEVLRTGLSKGADNAVHLFTTKSLRQLQIAKLLHYVVNRDNYDVILLGKQSIDDECGQTGQMLAGLLGCAQATQASMVDFNEKKEAFIITKEVDSGLETLEATMPVVITADLRLNTPRYASIANIMKAKKKHIEQIEVDTLRLVGESGIKTIDFAQVESHRSLKILNEIDELVDIMKDIK